MRRSSIQGAIVVACMFLLALVASITTSIQAYAKALPQAGQSGTSVSVTVKVRAIVLVHTGRLGVLMQYTVLPGNTLSGIAQSKCGRADDWPGIYSASRKVVGRNPDLIIPGQVLTLKCTNPPVRTTTHRTATPKANTARSGAYGHPYLCGDGDGDGWDMTCPKQVSPPPSRASVPPPVKLTSKTGCYDPSGHLSDAQVIMVWECAGGPAWAAQAAVAVSWCESGHNTWAHNPSGATGLFQILGPVVPGNLYDAVVNALNAVSKFKASGDTWAQWVCKP